MSKTKVQIRVEEDRVGTWKEAAWLRRTTLSEWMRQVLDANAQKVLGEKHE